MTKGSVLFFVLVCFWQLNFRAQKLSRYTWEEPKYLVQDDKFSDSEQSYLLRKLFLEFNYNDKTQKFEQIILNHFVIQVNSEKALKGRRELEPPMDINDRNLIAYKARIIHPDGSFYEFKKSDLKEKNVKNRPVISSDSDDVNTETSASDTVKIQEKDGDKKYFYFDLSELQVGSQIEYYSLIRNVNPNMSGVLLTYPQRFPVQQFDFQLDATKEFSFSFKPYNGVPVPVRDSSNKIRTVYSFKDSLISALPREKFSNYGANQKGLLYKLDGYELGKKRNIFNVEDFASSLYSRTYSSSKSEKAVVRKIIKELKFAKNTDDLTKVSTLENYIKARYAIYAVPGLNEIFSLENADKFGALSGENAARLMALALKELHVDHELVWTCNRFDYRFDKDFETNYFLDRMMLYVPSLDKMVDPNSKTMRLGLIPAEYTHNYGLFIREVTVGGISSGVGKISFIPAFQKENSLDKIDVRVKFLDGQREVDLEMERSMTGYFAADWQPIFRKTDTEQRLRFEKALFKFIDEGLQGVKTQFFNVDAKDVNVKPFVVQGKGRSTNLIEQKNDTLYFKIGKLIGPQSDLYKEEQRILPVERSSAREYQRTLTVELPEGYTALNLEKLRINREVINESGSVAAKFNSSYTLVNNQLTVRVEEWFSEIILPVRLYDDFRKVINASADFYRLELQLVK